jgi:hypothetical protein
MPLGEDMVHVLVRLCFQKEHAEQRLRANNTEKTSVYNEEKQWQESFRDFLCLILEALKRPAWIIDTAIACRCTWGLN